VLTVALLGTMAASAHTAQTIVAGQLAGAGGSASGGGLKLVGSIPASAAGLSSGGGLELTGGFIAAAQIWGQSAIAADAVASMGSGMVSGLAAIGTGGGAQITFTLSAPATVEVRVLNIAGRPIRTITPGRNCEAGLNTFAWTGMSDSGLRVPDGIYLVTVAAEAPDGSQTRALAQLRIAR